MSKTKDGTSGDRLVARRPRRTAARRQSPVKPRAEARKKLREKIHKRWASETEDCKCEADPMAPPKNNNMGDWVRYWSTDERLRRLECFAENLSKWLQADAKCFPEGFATWAQEVNNFIGGGGGDAPSKPPVYPPS